MVGTVLLTVGSAAWPPLVVNILVGIMAAAGFAFFPGLLVWWSAASGHYVRMHYPGALGYSVTVLGLLFCLTAIMWYAVAVF